MIKIQQPVEELLIAPEVTVGNRNRYSTATAVSFINENLLVAAAFNSKKIYLIELLEDGTSKILDVVKAKNNPDLLDYKDGVILTSDYPYMQANGHASLYDLVDNKIVFRKQIVVPNTKVHGCEIVDDKTIIITSNSDHNRGCMFIDIESHQVIKNLNNMKHYPKDAFIQGDRILVVCAESLPQIGSTTVIKESILYLFDLNTLGKLDEVSFHGQTDSLTLSGEDGFITIQGDDTVLHFKLIDDKLSIIKRIGGFNFPHGIDSIGNKIAVTNYGDNTIRIFELQELITT
jgi:DNA-binding beta-propeller fold protein YncE